MKKKFMFRIELNFLVIFPNTNFFLSSIGNTLVLFENIDIYLRPILIKNHEKMLKS